MTPFHYVQFFGSVSTIENLKEKLSEHITMMSDAYTSEITLQRKNGLAIISFTGYSTNLYSEILLLTKIFPFSCIFTTAYDCDDLLEITYIPQGGEPQELYDTLKKLPIYRNENGVEHFTDFDIHNEFKKRGLTLEQLALIFNGQSEQDLALQKEQTIEEHNRQDIETETADDHENTSSDSSDEIPF